MRIIPSGPGFKQADFFTNEGGLNITDSPFAVSPDQATGGYNFDYTNSGGFTKRAGHAKVNSSADTQTNTLGIALHNTSSGTKTVIRAAGTKIQNLDLDTPSFTNLSEDTTTATTNFLNSASTQPVVSSQFNTASANVLWMAGGGMDSIYGVYSSSKVTKNGVPVPAGSISATVGAGSSTFASTGTYRYAVAFRKTSTQALSNATLDVSATIANTTDKVTLDLSTISNVDTSKYDKIYIYRSAVGGSASFTTGDLVTTVNAGTASYIDTGTSTTSSTSVPRAASTTLDNSVLDSSLTYKYVTTFKRRLVTAAGSTLYFSDLNKPESWPTLNTITIPSGGDITGLAIISFTTPTTSSLDEYLVIFKERELWVVTGTALSDWALTFIDSVGCINQSLVVNANGYLAWVDYRGIYLWDGSGKPIYCSRPIEAAFRQDGDINKATLSKGFGNFYRKENYVIWTLSHKIFGENCLEVKLDITSTLPRIQSNLGGRVLDGVFIFDYHTTPFYAAAALLPPSDTDETLLAGDSSGYVYRMYNDTSDADAGIPFTYETKFLDMDSPGQSKRFNKVIVWVDEIGDWKLYLDYWANYRAALSEKSAKEAVISTNTSNAIALWNVAYWDVAFWDDYTPKLKGLVFNLDATNNNNEGDCLKLRFRQEEADSPVTIHGFSVIYSDNSLRK